MKCLGRFAFLFLPVLSGCLSGIYTPPATTPAVEKQKKTVKTGGACFDLGEGHRAAYTTKEFTDKVAELLTAKRQSSARHFVSLYPDLCLSALRAADPASAAAPELQFVAATYDALVGTANTPLSWTAMLKARRNDHPLLKLDAYRRAGEELLQAEQPEKAAVEFAAAVKISESHDAYQTMQLRLHLGEAYRRAGKLDQAVGAWQQAVMIAAQSPRIADPILWETAASLRPANTSWPDPVIAAMVPANAIRRSTGADETYLWKQVGQWRLDRGEPQAALLAFKRAESMCAEPNMQEDLQIQQASALAQLGQTAAAAAILTPLIDKPRPQIAAAALALLGSMKLQMNATPQAATLLRKAFEVASSADWLGRAEAEADLGLALLMTKDAAAGLDQLHAAQVRFEKAGNTFMLRQCLENEAAHWQKLGNATESARIDDRLKQIENH